MVTFTEEIRNRKLHFLYSVLKQQLIFVFFLLFCFFVLFLVLLFVPCFQFFFICLFFILMMLLLLPLFANHVLFVAMYLHFYL